MGPLAQNKPNLLWFLERIRQLGGLPKIIYYL
jgi:hypothetical protein